MTCAAAAAAAGGGAADGGAGGAGADRAATASAIGYLHAAANFFLIEDMERGETDVGYFFLTERDCLIRCERRCLRTSAADAVALPNSEKVNPAAPTSNCPALLDGHELTEHGIDPLLRCQIP